MTLPSSGAISLGQIHSESLGYTSVGTVSLNDADVRNMAFIQSGTISFSNLHGKSRELWTATVTTAASSYRGVVSTMPSNGSASSVSYTGSISDNTFDPAVQFNVAFSSTDSTAGVIEDLFTHSGYSPSWLRIYSYGSAISNAGWSSINASQSGYSKTLTRTSASYSYSSGGGYTQWQWSNNLFFYYNSTYTVTAYA